MNIHYVYHFGYVRWISHRLVVKPRGACKGNSRGGHARLVGCARKAEKGNDAYVSIHELTKNGKTYLVGNRLLSSLRARALAGPEVASGSVPLPVTRSIEAVVQIVPIGACATLPPAWT